MRQPSLSVVLHWAMSLRAIVLLWVRTTAADRPTCPSGQPEWYTNQVSETPCDTYLKLLRVCDPTYNLPVFPKGQDPNSGLLLTCNETIVDPTCCANPVAFQLSKLCSICECGYDNICKAQHVTYKQYLNGAANTSKFNTHEEACKAGIFVPEVIYDNPNPLNGSWSCAVLSGKYANTSAGIVSSCPPPAVTGSSSSVRESPSSQTSSSTTDAPSLPPMLSGTAFRNKISGDTLSAGTIVGIVVGTTAIIGILLGCIWFIRRLRRLGTLKSMKPRTADLQPPPADTAAIVSRSERKATAYRSWSFMPLLQNRASSPVTMTDGHTMIGFSPDLMVRQPNEPLPTSRYLRPVSYDAWDTKSLNSMPTDSRVELPLDISIDPNIPIQPLRYGSKKEEL